MRAGVPDIRTGKVFPFSEKKLGWLYDGGQDRKIVQLTMPSCETMMEDVDFVKKIM